jgi:hypothetical protein
MSLLAVTLLLALLLNAQGARTQAARSLADTAVTLSVYTCCGSLSGFNDTNAADLSSMHTVYGSLWSQQFPGLRWRETTFDNQSTLAQHLATAVHAGNPPDMVFVQGDYIGYMVLPGLAQPLDQYFASAHATSSTFLPGMARWAHFGGHWWAVPAVSGPVGGQYIYLPRYAAPLGFNNHNLVTFDDYDHLSQKAVQFDAAGNLQRIGYWPGVDSWETIGTLMCPPGHGLYNAADQPTATDPCNVAYLSYLKKLSDLYGGYDKLSAFLSHDPDFLTGSKNSYLATGKAIIPPSGFAYWNIPPLDANSFGVKGGLSYQLTRLPVTVHGSMAEATNYPSTQQEVIIPRGAAHPDLAFAVSKMMFWDYNYLLGRSTSGSPVRKAQSQWLTDLIGAEGATRKQAGLPGNPFAQLAGVKLQPALGLISKASNPINPVDLYYQLQLHAATVRVLSGQETPEFALAGVQTRVLAEEQQLRAKYGAWNW